MSLNKVTTSLIDFDNLEISEAANRVEQLSNSDGFSYVVTPNMDHLMRLCDDDSSDDRAYALSYGEASLVLCDSRVVGKLLSLVGKPVKAIVPGSDLTQYLFDHSFFKDKKVLVFGGEDSAMKQLSDIYPDLHYYHINPSMGFISRPSEVEQLIADVKAIEADYILLAVGSPRQENFAYQLKHAGLMKGVALCIGASINFIVKNEKRAPEWMQKLHIEWLYRMLQDPKRLVKRYSSNALYAPKIIRGLYK